MMAGVKDKIMSLFKTNITSIIVNHQVSKKCTGVQKIPRKPRIKITEHNIIKNIRNLFKPKNENETIRDRIIRDIRIVLEHEEDYYKPVRVGNFYSNNYIEYESNGYINKTLPIKPGCN